MSKQTGSKVLNLSSKHWVTHYNNCSGLVKAVATDLGINLTGTANQIMDKVNKSPWIKIKDGVEAKRKVEQEGYFVIAGKKEKKNGHVVIIVPGPMDWRGKYPTGYWGNLGAQVDTKKPINTSKKQYGTINWSWSKENIGSVSYHGIKIPGTEKKSPAESMKVMPDAHGGVLA